MRSDSHAQTQLLATQLTMCNRGLQAKVNGAAQMHPTNLARAEYSAYVYTQCGALLITQLYPIIRGSMGAFEQQLRSSCDA